MFHVRSPEFYVDITSMYRIKYISFAMISRVRFFHIDNAYGLFQSTDFVS